jgi:hypothetical protein
MQSADELFCAESAFAKKVAQILHIVCKALSPLGRGEGVGGSVKLRPVRLAAKPENKRALCGRLRQNYFSQP